MHSLIEEKGTFGSNPGVKDIARHLFTRMYAGKVIVIVDNPKASLAPLRKQWLKLCHKVQKERSSTITSTRVAAFSNLITRMQTLKFSYKWLSGERAHVYLVTIEDLAKWPPEPDVQTMYVTIKVDRATLYKITSFLPKGALLAHIVIAKTNSRI